MPSRTQLDIAAATARTPSPEHKRFQALLLKIETARERLLLWQQQLPLFAQMHNEKAVPEISRLMAARREWALELEALLAAQRWAKTDARALRELICDVAGSLIDGEVDSDGAMKTLYNRHAETDFDDEEQEQLQSLKGLLEAMGGLDLGDEKIESADELFQRARKNMAEQTQAFDQQHAQTRSHGGGKPAKPKRPTAAQKRAEEDARRISQTVREVYRKLASALHPDRVTDEAERASRTAQMQRANTAYEAGDLLALLELQLQIEQVDIAHVAGIAAQQVRHFNKVLAEQLGELEREIDGRQHAFCASYGLMADGRINPKQLGDLLKDEMRELASAHAALARDRRTLKGDPAGAKRWIKQWRAVQRAMDFGPFF